MNRVMMVLGACVLSATTVAAEAPKVDPRAGEPEGAPDYASHVDIHNKPGYDPTELFFFGRKIVKGTHGRKSIVATHTGRYMDFADKHGWRTNP